MFPFSPAEKTNVIERRQLSSRSGRCHRPFIFQGRPLIGCFTGLSAPPPLTLIQCGRHCLTYTNQSNATLWGLIIEWDHNPVCACHCPQVVESQQIIIGKGLRGVCWKYGVRKRWHIKRILQNNTKKTGWLMTCCTQEMMFFCRGESDQSNK